LDIHTGFPRSIKSNEKVLDFEISFQDLEKVLNLAKMYMKVLKKYGNSNSNRLFIQIFFHCCYDSSAEVFCTVVYQ